MSDSTRKQGNESFHINGVAVPDNVLAFWQWSSSRLLDNALRGMLAEFIVAMDLGCVGDVRQEWASYDLRTLTGVTVEVKSAAYVQSWPQKQLSAIRFGIQPTLGWDPETNEYSERRMRQSDVYVFCVLTHTDRSTVDPLDLAQWRFYVLSTRQLDKSVGEQKTISLSSLLRLEPRKAAYGKIAQAIDEVLKA